MSHGDWGFFDALGPFFCSRAIHRELGGPIYSDYRYRWIVARSGSKVVGWISMQVDDDRITADWAWVHPSHRGHGVYRSMECEMLKQAEGRALYRSTRHPWLKERWLAYGFRVRFHRGRWTYFVRDEE